MRLSHATGTSALLFACAYRLPHAIAAETSDQACDADGTCADAKPKQKQNPFDAVASWFDNGIKSAAKFFNDEIFSDAEGSGEKGEGGTSMYDQVNKAFEGTLGDTDEKKDDSLFGLARLLSSTFATKSEENVNNLIDRARQFVNDGGVNETRTLQETFNLFNNSLSIVNDALERSFGHIDLKKFSLASLFYFLEYEDERKNPSWKRRMHRFFKAVDPMEVYELHDALWLAEVSYADTAEQVQTYLNTTVEQYELVYAKMESAPNEPAHFIALKKQQKRWSNSLEVLVSVRGTKQIGDLFSDAFLDVEDFRGGKAHAGVKASGQYLVRKHTDLLRMLLDMSNKKRIKLVLVGHSLGAGAASIAAMEFNDLDFVDATVVGFGCPSLLTKDLSESAKNYILTVVTDSDVVPRMSGATMENVVLDLMGYDWSERALRDVQQLIDVVRTNIPFDMPKSNDESVLRFVNSTLDKTLRPQLKEIPKRRLSPVLIPPGRCVHFYRDGSGFSGRHTPCDFFDSIDVTWTMIDDHLTNTGYHRALLNFIRDYRNDMNFKFRHEPIF